MGAYEEKGSDARLNSFFGAYSLCDLVKTTLGPKGMDKILKPFNMGPKQDIIVTNDGATILSHVLVDNPAAKLLVDISRT
jgi:T-complex protein 1 subunit beta